MSARPTLVEPRLRPTRSSLPVLFGSVALLLIGMQSRNEPLVLVACGGLGLLGAAFLCARRNLRGVRVARRVPAEVFAGAPFRTVLELRNEARSPSSLLLVRDHVQGERVVRRRALVRPLASLDAAVQARLEIECRFRRRGVRRFTHLAVESRHPLGLFRAEIVVPCEDRILVYPERIPVPLPARLRDGRLAATAVSATAGRGDDEFAGLREFRPGDPPRRIHWRSSARLPGRLLVRELDRTPPPRVRLRLDAAIRETPRRDRGRFERAVKTAASLASELVAHGHRVEFRLRARQTRTFEIRPTDRSLYALLAALARIEPVTPSELAPLGPDASRPGTPSLVLRPSEFAPGASLGALLDAAWEAP